jgi:APA family basic amino acid/polyamine antiporter
MAEPYPPPFYTSSLTSPGGGAVNRPHPPHPAGPLRGPDRTEFSRKPFELVRGLGPWAASAIVIGTMIGTGIFIVPADMARTVGTPGLVFAVWVVGGALSLFGALAYAELGAAIPVAGGEYAYLGRAYSPVWGFLFGWQHSIVGRPASLATIAAGLLRFWGFLMPTVMAPLAVWHTRLPFSHQPYDFVFTPAQPLAAAVIALVTGVNYLGVRLGGQVQVALTVIKVAVVAAVVAIGFALSGHGTGAAAPAATAGGTAVGGFLTALVAALWAYDGWSNVNLVGEELTEPEKNIPRALVTGVIFVALAYMGVSAACFRALPFAAVASSPHVASDVVAKFAGRTAADWLTIAMVVCALGTLNSSILSGARVDYAMARDGLFFRATRSIHPKHRTPAGALIFQACLAGVLALTGTFEDLFSLFIFAQWIFYALATASVIWLRHKEPALPRPYRAWGYPVFPVLFVLGAAALTMNLWLERPVRSSIGLVLILAGLIFYRDWRRSNQPPRAEHPSHSGSTGTGAAPPGSG